MISAHLSGSKLCAVNWGQVFVAKLLGWAIGLDVVLVDGVRAVVHQAESKKAAHRATLFYSYEAASQVERLDNLDELDVKG